MTKYIFVTGGVVSSVGKGIVAAAMGRMLKERGLQISVQKLDPYLNVDPGTMSPYQHGEVFVTNDGAETDLDLGHYERFIDINLQSVCNVTTGQLYSDIITAERRGDYLGGTIQVIPHITNEIKRHIKQVPIATGADIIIVEVGGTIGDIESMHFIEAIRQLSFENINDMFCFIHVSLVTKIFTSSEFKTKPTQNSISKFPIVSPNISSMTSSSSSVEKSKPSSPSKLSSPSTESVMLNSSSICSGVMINGGENTHMFQSGRTISPSA